MLLRLTQAYDIDIAEPFMKWHKMGTFLEQFASLVSEKLVKHFECPLTIWVEKHAKQEMAQVEDKDHEL